MADGTIFVKPTAKAEDRVVLFENDERHPDGEVFLRGYADPERLAKEDADEVFPTARVLNAIHEGLLAETSKAGKEKSSTTSKS